jgi:hypothetical protein
VEEADGQIRLHGRVSPDPLLVPGSIFVLLSKLDGATPWRDALAAARREGATELDDALVASLWAGGILAAP